MDICSHLCVPGVLSPSAAGDSPGLIDDGLFGLKAKGGRGTGICLILHNVGSSDRTVAPSSAAPAGRVPAELCPRLPS